jgi:hypothetical protein
MNPFHHSTKEPIQQNPKTVLDQEIKKLEEQSFKLHADIMREPFAGHHKKPLMAKRAKILQEINDLKLKKEELENKEYGLKTHNLISNQREFIHLSMRGRRINIPKDLNIEVDYYPCGHKEKIYLPNLLRKPSLPVKNLFERWLRFLNSNEIISCARVPCQQCRKERPSTLNTKSLIAEPLGHIDWTLRRLQ